MKTMKFVVFAIIVTSMVGLYAADADVAVQQPPVATPVQADVATKDIAAAPVVDTKPVEEMKKDMAPTVEPTQVPVTAPVPETKPEAKKEDAPQADVVVPAAPVTSAQSVPASDVKKDEAPKASVPEATQSTASQATQGEPSDKELAEFFKTLAEGAKTAEETKTK